MYISTDKIVSMTEANRNFSKVAKMVDDKKEIVIMKNNKPRYVMMDYEEYEGIKEMGFKVSDVRIDYGSPALKDRMEKVSEDGMVRVPESIMETLNIKNTGKVTFVEEDGKVSLINPALFAFRKLQKALEGKAEEAGFNSPEDVNKLLEEIRQELWDEWYADND